MLLENTWKAVKISENNYESSMYSLLFVSSTINQYLITLFSLFVQRL